MLPASPAACPCTLPHVARRGAALALCLLLLTSCSPPSGLGPGSLEEKITARTVRHPSPALMVGIYRGGETLLERGWGSCGPHCPQPPDAHTVFRIGSVGKMFVAAAALLLEADGLLSLDDPVSRFVPGVPNGGAITLEMLGNHTSGLFNYIADPEPKQIQSGNPAHFWTAEQLLAIAYRHPPRFPTPGKGWAYSNSNTILLGLALEKASGLPLDRLLRQRVFDPLGMEATAYQTEALLPAPHARGHNLGGPDAPSLWRGRGDILHDTTHCAPSIWQAAGAYHSTLHDLRLFLDALQNDRLLPPSARQKQRHWRRTGWRNEDLYGFGLMNSRGVEGHNGQVPGYSAFAGHDPASGSTVIVLAGLYADSRNQSPADAVAWTILGHLRNGKDHP